MASKPLTPAFKNFHLFFFSDVELRLNSGLSPLLEQFCIMSLIFAYLTKSSMIFALTKNFTMLPLFQKPTLTFSHYIFIILWDQQGKTEKCSGDCDVIFLTQICYLVNVSTIMPGTCEVFHCTSQCCYSSHKVNARLQQPYVSRMTEDRLSLNKYLSHATTYQTLTT